MRILLIEDDRVLGAQLVRQLCSAGYELEWWTEGRSLDGLGVGVALVILDLMLPGTYGLQILRELRPRCDVPVLVLSARDDTATKVRAFELGADDYLTKPFWPEELLLRVRARLRRPLLSRSDVVVFGELRIDAARLEVQLHGARLELRRAELAVLWELAKRRGEPVSRESLIEHALGRHSGGRSLDVHVSRLRRKLGDNRWIETVWGIGYRLVDPDPDRAGGERLP